MFSEDFPLDVAALKMRRAFRRVTPAFYVNSYLTLPFKAFYNKLPDFVSFDLLWIHIRFTLDSPWVHNFTSHW